MGNLSNAPLWQDEAESALNALTISSGKSHPQRERRRESTALLHEMSLYYKADDPKYEYLPTHFLETPYVTIHGWLPYYFIRLGIGIFGKNEIGPRFFSVIFFGLALAVLYVMIRRNSVSCLGALCGGLFLPHVQHVRLLQCKPGIILMRCFLTFSASFPFGGSRRAKAGYDSGSGQHRKFAVLYISSPPFILHQVVFVLFILLIKKRSLEKICHSMSHSSACSRLPHLW